MVLLASVSFAHVGEEVEEHDTADEMPAEDCPAESCFIENSLSYNILAAETGLGVLVVISLLSIAFRKNLKVRQKKCIFAAMCSVIIAVTGFIVFTTIYSNYFSASGGPVHWHADYEIWVCGERMHLEESEGLENKVGTPVFHHHNDDRIHVEGVVYELEDIALGKFFEAIGGHIDNEMMRINLINGSVKEVRNGDLCDGTPGILRMFVNGNQPKDRYDATKTDTNFDRYIIAPFGTVPPGDSINITFGP